jgi:hypothetical protein
MSLNNSLPSKLTTLALYNSYIPFKDTQSLSSIIRQSQETKNRIHELESMIVKLENDYRIKDQELRNKMYEFENIITSINLKIKEIEDVTAKNIIQMENVNDVQKLKHVQQRIHHNHNKKNEEREKEKEKEKENEKENQQEEEEKQDIDIDIPANESERENDCPCDDCNISNSTKYNNHNPEMETFESNMLNGDQLNDLLFIEVNTPNLQTKSSNDKDSTQSQSQPNPSQEVRVDIDLI